jgi:heat shock protein HspQ
MLETGRISKWQFTQTLLKSGDLQVDKLELYRSIVTEILTKYSQDKPSYGQVEIEQIFDRDHDRYQLLAIGWNQQQRIYGATIHLDIQDEKIWIQQNTTELE